MIHNRFYLDFPWPLEVAPFLAVGVFIIVGIIFLWKGE